MRTECKFNERFIANFLSSTKDLSAWPGLFLYIARNARNVATIACNKGVGKGFKYDTIYYHKRQHLAAQIS